MSADMVPVLFPVILTDEDIEQAHAEVQTRDTGRVKQIDAETDVDAVKAWLLGFKDSPKTIRAYRREAERFLLYLQAFRPKASLTRLMVGDTRAYETFAKDPGPEWISKKKVARQDPRWRPFAGPLSKSSNRHAMLILKAMMVWLQAAGYAAANPFELDKKKWRQKNTAKPVTRYLTQAAIQDMFDAVDAMPVDTKAKTLEKARGRFMVALYYDSALRLFEPANVTMAAVERDLLGAWINIVGKGDKPARVPLSLRTMEAFNAYRVVLGLSGLHADDVPLLVAARGDRRRATEGTIAKALERIMRSAAGLARARDREIDAIQLDQATPHWLRHSRVSHLINNGKNVQLVRALARHESLQTTGIYSHAEQIELQQLVGGSNE